MAETTTLTVRLSEDAQQKLDALARSTGRSKTFLVAEVVENFLASNAWQIEEIGKAVAQADAGEPFYRHEEVMTYLETRALGGKPKRPDPISS